MHYVLFLCCCLVEFQFEKFCGSPCWCFWTLSVAQSVWEIFKNNCQAYHQFHPVFASLSTLHFDSVIFGPLMTLSMLIHLWLMNRFCIWNCNILKCMLLSSPYFPYIIIFGIGIVFEQSLFRCALLMWHLSMGCNMTNWMFMYGSRGLKLVSGST
jgi:hypothetical protein